MVLFAAIAYHEPAREEQRPNCRVSTIFLRSSAVCYRKV